MKNINITLTITLLLTSSYASAFSFEKRFRGKSPSSLKCVGSSLCSLSKMPLLNQGSRQIFNHLRQNGVSTEAAQNGCGPVSYTMAIGALANGNDNIGALKTLEDFKVNSHSSQAKYPVHKLYKKLKTGKNGSSLKSSVSRINSFLASSGKKVRARYSIAGFANAKTKVGKVLKFGLSYVFGSKAPYLKLKDLRNMMKSRRNGSVVISAFKFKRKKKFWRKYYSMSGTGGHFVTIKGFKNERVQINDPWGLTYYAELKKSKTRLMSPFGRKSKKTVIYRTSGKNGYMKKAGGKTRTILTSYHQFSM